jgi:two-component system CheB/CheR fusion protein
VNAELHAKVEQLSDMQNDMKNLLDNVNVGTVFLDRTLNIRRFTRDATGIYRLMPSDVGRPLADIRSGFAGEDLLIEAQRVLDTLQPYRNEVLTNTGLSYLVSIQPYRTLDNLINGVVMSFTDITTRVALEAKMQIAHEMAEGIVDTVREPLLVLDGSLKVVFASRSFYRDFAVTPEETLGRQLYDLGNRQWDIPRLRELLENILPQNRTFDDYPVEHDFPGIGTYNMRLNARSIPVKTGEPKYILLAMEHVTGESSSA